MKYFLLLDKTGKRHIVVAEDFIGAARVVEIATMKADDLYELTAETFTEPGFLISDK